MFYSLCLSRFWTMYVCRHEFQWLRFPLSFLPVGGGVMLWKDKAMASDPGPATEQWEPQADDFSLVSLSFLICRMGWLSTSWWDDTYKVHALFFSPSTHGKTTAVGGTREKTMELHSQDGLSGEGMWPDLETRASASGLLWGWTDHLGILTPFLCCSEQART